VTELSPCRLTINEGVVLEFRSEPNRKETSIIGPVQSTHQGSLEVGSLEMRLSGVVTTKTHANNARAWIRADYEQRGSHPRGDPEGHKSMQPPSPNRDVEQFTANMVYSRSQIQSLVPTAQHGDMCQPQRFQSEPLLGGLHGACRRSRGVRRVRVVTADTET